MNTKTPEKKRTIALRSYVTEKEYEQIVDLSEKVSLSVSELTRRLLLGHEVQSKEDRHVFLDLLKVNADLGRIGGLLKFWLSDSKKSAGHSDDVRGILRQVEENQKAMQELIRERRQA